MGIVGGDHHWTFRRSYLRGICGALALSVVLAAATAVVVPHLLPVTTARSTRATLAIVSAVVVAIVVWGSFFWVRNIRVVMTEHEVEVRRPFLRMHSWERAHTVFQSSVIEHRTHGVRTRTTRSLVAIERGGTTATIDLDGFDRKTFNALMATLSPRTGQGRSAQTPFDVQYPSTGACRFRIDLGALRAASRRLALAGGGASALAAAGIVLLLRPGISDDQIVAVALGLSLAGPTAIGLLSAAAVAALRASAMPESIRIHPTGLELDGVVYEYRALRAIQVSPSSYPVKRVVLVDRGGHEKVFTLGRSGAEMAPDYGQFVRALIESSALSPGLVTFDLG